jgi:acyl carrier protein phosphodiesterase
MNFLAHAYLSFNDSEILTGNMIGDYVKGRNILSTFPEKIKSGILLHREIDRFTDEHQASKYAASFFKNHYGRYAPAIIDSLFDHYLANDKNYFKEEEILFDFSQTTYKLLIQQEAYFPEKFATFFPYMKEQNWLYNYRSHDGINRSLYGLHRRAKYMPIPDAAYCIFLEKYEELNGAYQELLLPLTSFARIFLDRML